MVLTDPQKHRDMSSKGFLLRPTEYFLTYLILTVLQRDCLWLLSSIGNDTEGSGRGHERDIDNNPVPEAFNTLRCAHFMTTLLGTNEAGAKSYFSGLGFLWKSLTISGFCWGFIF